MTQSRHKLADRGAACHGNGLGKLDGGACLGTREPRCPITALNKRSAPRPQRRSPGYAAGDARGFPFSTTYVIRMMHLASAGLPPAWGVSGGIWKASPFLIA